MGLIRFDSLHNIIAFIMICNVCEMEKILREAGVNNHTKAGIIAPHPVTEDQWQLQHNQKALSCLWPQYIFLSIVN